MLNFDKYVRWNRTKMSKLRNGQFTLIPADDFADYLKNKGIRNFKYTTATSPKRLTPSTDVYVVCLHCNTRRLHVAGELTLKHLKCDCVKNMGVHLMKKTLKYLTDNGMHPDLCDLLKRKISDKAAPYAKRPLRMTKINKSLNLFLRNPFTMLYKNYVGNAPNLLTTVRCDICSAARTMRQDEVLSNGHTICKHFQPSLWMTKHRTVTTPDGRSVQVPAYVLRHAKLLLTKLKISGDLMSSMDVFDFPFTHDARRTPLFKLDNTFIDIIDWQDWTSSRAVDLAGLPNSSQTRASLFRLYHYMQRNNIDYQVYLVNPDTGAHRKLLNTTSFKEAYAEFLATQGK